MIRLTLIAEQLVSSGEMASHFVEPLGMLETNKYRAEKDRQDACPTFDSPILLVGEESKFLSMGSAVDSSSR